MPLDGKNGFATYTRDASTGLDNAFHRNYHPAWGRFTTPDPYQASGAPADPQSWNRYAYVGGDPVNRNDRKGLFWCPVYDGGEAVGGWWCGPMMDPHDRQLIEPEELRVGGGSQMDANTNGIGDALRNVLDALGDPDCKGIFNTTGSGKYSPQDVIRHLVSGFLLSDRRKIGIVGFSTQVREGRFAEVQATGYQGPRGPIFDKADIVIRDSASDGYWHAVSSQVQALALLHELGHVFALVDGLGGSRIKNDAKPNGEIDWDAQLENAAVLDPCARKLGIAQ
jgi:RHS repeat-associated protein